MPIPPLRKMLKELGTVNIRYHEGMYDASCDGTLQYGQSPEGAVWNVLRVKRESAKSGKAPKDDPTMTTDGIDQGGVRDIPSAGQDSCC